MSILEKYHSGKLVVSIEIFPPKTEKGLESLESLLEDFQKFSPDFVSVTYGAGGTTRDTTLAVVKSIKEIRPYDVMPHFTCVSHTKEEIDQIVRLYEKAGVDNILALRGDPPKGSQTFVPTAGGFAYAIDLIRHLKSNHKFDIGCAGFPEGHIESPDMQSDCLHLKNKIEAGASFVLTQFFFCNDKFYEWREKLNQLGVDAPLVPGIWFPMNQETTYKFSKMNRVTIPHEVAQIYEKYTSEEDITKASMEFTRKQVEDLIANGVPGLHVYSFNKIQTIEVFSDYFVNHANK